MLNSDASFFPLQERIRNIFATPTANDDLVDWCESQFATIQTELDGKIIYFICKYHLTNRNLISMEVFIILR